MLVAGVEAGLAAGLSYWLAALVLDGRSPVYAAVAAVAVTGAGHDRRIARVKAMLSGMAIAIVVSEIGVRAAGTGPIRIAVLTCVSIVVARLALEDLLAVTYAGFNAAVLAALGGDGWLPTRAIEAVIGAVTAYGLVYLVFPPRPARYSRKRVIDQAATAVDVMRSVAQSLRSDRASSEAWRGSESIDRKVDSLRETFDFSREVSRFSPWRSKDRWAIEQLSIEARRLQDVFAQVTTLVRVAARLANRRVGGEGHLAEAIELQSKCVEALAQVVTSGLVDGTEVDRDGVLAVLELADRATERARAECGDDRGMHRATVEVIAMLSDDMRQLVRRDDQGGSVGREAAWRPTSAGGHHGSTAC